MVDLRRWFPALAIATLFMGTAVTASAQLTCSAAQGVVPLVRSEGVAELLGDVVLTCTGGTVTPTTSLVPTINFQLFLNTNITSRILTGNLTEALLVIDDPTPDRQVPCVPTGSATSCSFVGSGDAGDPTPGINRPGGVNYREGDVPNVYQGALVSQAGSLPYLFWSQVPVDPPGTVGIRRIRITNLRGNANTGGVALPGTSFIPSQINAFLSVNATMPLAFQQPTQGIQVGFPLRGLGGFSVVAGDQTTPPFLQCLGNSFLTDGGDGNVNNTSFRARFIEGFASAFKTRTGVVNAHTNAAGTALVAVGIVNPITDNPSTGTAYDASVQPALPLPVAFQAMPGQSVFSETGLWNGGAQFVGTTYQGAGLADSGTRLLLRLNNIPTGVTVYAGLYESGADASSSRVVMVSTDANGAGPSGGGFTVASETDVTDSEFPVAAVSVSSTGTATLVYEITAADPGSVEQIDIPFIVTFAANSATLTPSNAIPTLSGELAPISTNNTSSPSGTWIPRFVDLPQSGNAFVINPCRTNLLFPYVVHSGGYETGMAISNTSRDIFGTALQSGPCTINYFGATAGGGAAPPAQTTTTPVAAGGQLIFTLSGGFSTHAGVTGAPGLTGYIIAQCDFQYAHGFAFISDVNAARVAEGYLALVMDSPTGSRTTYQSESLNQ